MKINTTFHLNTFPLIEDSQEPTSFQLEAEEIHNKIDIWYENQKTTPVSSQYFYQEIFEYLSEIEKTDANPTFIFKHVLDLVNKLGKNTLFYYQPTNFSHEHKGNFTSVANTIISYMNYRFNSFYLSNYLSPSSYLNDEGLKLISKYVKEDIGFDFCVCQNEQAFVEKLEHFHNSNETKSAFITHTSMKTDLAHVISIYAEKMNGEIKVLIADSFGYTGHYLLLLNAINNAKIDHSILKVYLLEYRRQTSEEGCHIFCLEDFRQISKFVKNTSSVFNHLIYEELAEKQDLEITGCTILTSGREEKTTYTVPEEGLLYPVYFTMPPLSFYTTTQSFIQIEKNITLAKNYLLTTDKNAETNQKIEKEIERYTYKITKYTYKGQDDKEIKDRNFKLLKVLNKHYFPKLFKALIEKKTMSTQAK